jgi:hypothetical protein
MIAGAKHETLPRDPRGGVVCHGGAAAAATPPVAVFSPIDGSARTLARLAPHSLRPAAPRVRLPEYHDNWSFSPDGSRVALGMGGAGDSCGRGICIVDVRSMTIVAQIPAPTAVQAVAWLRARRIVGVLQTGGIIVGDPVTGTVVQRRASRTTPTTPRPRARQPASP